MPQVYTVVPAANLTAGTSLAETFFLRPGATRSASLARVDVAGQGGGVTQMSGIGFDLYTFATSSTAGTAITPALSDVQGSSAATATAASRPTAGTTKTVRGFFGCTASGPNGWAALNQDYFIVMSAANAGCIGMNDTGAVASMPFKFSLAFQE